MNHPAHRKFDATSLDTVAPEEIAAWASPPARRGPVRPAQQAAKPRDTKTRSAKTPATRAGATGGQRSSISPTDCRSEYSEAELELMQAMKDYKESSGRMFPTWSEVLEVLQGLGYRKNA